MNGCTIVWRGSLEVLFLCVRMLITFPFSVLRGPAEPASQSDEHNRNTALVRTTANTFTARGIIGRPLCLSPLSLSLEGQFRH